jgi:hypothetical protein
LFALVVFGCAPKTANPELGSDSESVETKTEEMAFVWSAENDCATCHAAEEISYSDALCPMNFHPELVCTDCHIDNEALAGAHEGLTYANTEGTTQLRKTVVAESSCTDSDCHLSGDALVQTTVSSVVLTDVKRNVVNPHDLPVFEDRGRGSHVSILCGDCHQLHSAESIEETAADVCKNCHHKGTYETCYSALCHE